MTLSPFQHTARHPNRRAGAKLGQRRTGVRHDRHSPLAARAAALCGVASANAAEDPLDGIKKLEGTWLAVDEKGRTLDQISSMFRVTSTGHSVIEIVFPGTPHEMINVYYRDIDNMLVPTDKPDVVTLEFMDITNMVTIDDEHMHEGQ
ncbi:MAG: hypothetical protein FJ197_04540 [Gammaproteobacteria bacterium]|nr:hypothetical protein [Gammaproteobacteria bacterium]